MAVSGGCTAQGPGTRCGGCCSVSPRQRWLRGDGTARSCSFPGAGLGLKQGWPPRSQAVCRKQGGGSESLPLAGSPPPHCPDGSARDASRGSPGTKGIPGSREVGYKGCNGSQVHAVTRMPFPSPRLTQIPARSWSQTQQDMECPGPVHMDTFVAAQNTDGIVYPPSSTAPLGHQCWHISAQFEPAACSQDTASTRHSARDRDLTHHAELCPDAIGHGPGSWAQQVARDI